MGTLHYASPELLSGEPVDKRTDIWALGVVLYEMLSGYPPFRKEYDQATIYAVLHREPHPLSEIRDDVTEELWKIISNCLKKNPVDRYREIEILINDINNFSKGIPIGIPPSQKKEANENNFQVSDTNSTEQRILIIEDDPAILSGLKESLEEEHYKVISESDGNKGYQIARQEKIDLIILDLMLPGKNGQDICKDLRNAGFDTLILMLTSKREEIDRVLGLELGADDYITKPFSVHELKARIKALFRRTPPKRI
jgi:CheY-like chemotaxis protein